MLRGPLHKREQLISKQFTGNLFRLKLFINLAYDFMEKNGHCTDYIEATDLEKYALRIWMKKYIDQLPEYRYILDDILSQ